MPAQKPVPEITDPLGKGWRQPKLEDIEFSLSHAHMSQESFNQLYNYELSIPSGVYDGKMWRSRDRRGRPLLMWYGPHPDPVRNLTTCGIYSLGIQIVK